MTTAARDAPTSMDGNPNIDIDIVERDGMVLVAVEGEVDLCTADVFARSLAIAEEMDTPAIVLDLDRVSFMDSAGLHVLLQFSAAERTRDRVSVTQGSPQVQRLLEVTGVRRYLSFVRSPAAVRLNGS
jgi:anti-sigma B factor antagonist